MRRRRRPGGGGIADLLRPVRPAVARVEVAQLRRFGRSVLGVLFRADVLVLATRGRRTGRVRETPVAYVEHDGGWLVSAGAGGQRTVDWVANLRAEPRATVWVRGRRAEVVAEPLAGARGEHARAVALARWPRLEVYERRAGRPAPMFLLRPARPGG